MAPMIVVVIKLLCSTAAISARLGPVAQNLDVIEMTMTNNKFAAFTPIEAAVRAPDITCIVVDVPILKEKEIRAAIIRGLRPCQVAVWRSSVLNLTLLLLIVHVVFDDMVGHAED